mmetsp:Transcript_9142/g.28337  ORF Transcript_9142/g.28337 Transcript_9142/m.28337 type:complete len:283 (+) Transcript_9142:96-944(+)
MTSSSSHHEMDSSSSAGPPDLYTKSRSSFAKIFMALAVELAHRSGDSETKVGCVLVNNQNQILGIGYNAEPKGTTVGDANYDKDVMVHAEMNAIAHASANLMRETMYMFVTRLPCPTCMKLLCQFNFRGVFFLYSRPNDTEYNPTYILAQSASIPLIPYDAVWEDLIVRPASFTDPRFHFETKSHHLSSFWSQPKWTVTLTNPKKGDVDLEFNFEQEDQVTGVSLHHLFVARWVKDLHAEDKLVSYLKDDLEGLKMVPSTPPAQGLPKTPPSASRKKRRNNG